MLGDPFNMTLKNHGTQNKIIKVQFVAQGSNNKD